MMFQDTLGEQGIHVARQPVGFCKRKCIQRIARHLKPSKACSHQDSPDLRPNILPGSWYLSGTAGGRLEVDVLEIATTRLSRSIASASKSGMIPEVSGHRPVAARAAYFQEAKIRDVEVVLLCSLSSCHQPNKTWMISEVWKELL